MADNMFAALEDDVEEVEEEEEEEEVQGGESGGAKKKKKKNKKKKKKSTTEIPTEIGEGMVKEGEENIVSEEVAKEANIHDQLEVGALTKEQKEAVTKLRERVLGDKDLPVSEGHIRVWLEDSQAFKRFLIARNWDQDESFKMISAAIIWRKEYKPWAISVDEIEHCLRGGHMYTDIHDKVGHSCVYMRQHTKPDPTTDEVAMKYMMWSFEQATYRMMKETKGERYKMVWFVSNDGYNPKYMRSMKFVKELTNNVQGYYPERLHRCYFFYAPAMFRMFWSVVRPFLDPITRSKFTFLTGKKDALETLGKEFDLETVEDHFYGKRDSKAWSGEEYVTFCREIEKEMAEYYSRRADEILNPPQKRTGKNQRKKNKKKEEA